MVSIAPTQPRRTRMRAISRGRAAARLLGRSVSRVQVRRHRACEIERPLYDPGAKKEYRNEF